MSAFGSIKRHKDAVHFGIRKKFTERECPICHKSYFQLQKHIKIKHKESKVKCGICDRVLSCSFSYKRHLKKVHGYYRNNPDQGVPPQGIKVDVPVGAGASSSSSSSKNKEGGNNMDYSGFNSSGSSESSYKKPEPPTYGIPPAFVDPMMRMEAPPPPLPAVPPETFHHLMPGMYPPPFTPFKRDYPPGPPANQQQSGGSSSSSSSSSTSGSMMTAPQYGAYQSPTPSPYQYPPFYMNDQRAQSLLKNGTKELANILGIDTNNLTGAYVNQTQVAATGAGSTSSNTCTICGNNFKDASSLRRHTRIKHASKFQAMEDSKAESKKYKCHLCNVSLSCSGSIQRHIRLMHNKVGSQPAEKLHPDFPYPCPVCHRTFANEISLQRHASYHKKTGELPPDTNISSYTTCTPCDRGFENNWSYERHLMQHPTPSTPLAPVGKICNVCNLVVTTSMSLRRHKKLKHPDLYLAEENRKSELELKKRYKCTLCSKPIASYSSLQRHMKLVHNKTTISTSSGKAEGDGLSGATALLIKTEPDTFSHEQPNNLSLNRFHH